MVGVYDSSERLLGAHESSGANVAKESRGVKLPSQNPTFLRQAGRES